MSAALRRAVQVLDALREDAQGSSIRDLAARVELPKSTVQRILADLVDVDLAAQDPTSRLYRLGPRTLALGTAYQRRLDVRAAALPHMVALRDALDETIGLSVRAVDELLHVDQVESRSRLRAVFDLGLPLPLWSGAPSKVLLAALSDADARRVVERRTERHVEPVHPLDPEDFLAEVRAARADGHASARDETLPGVSTLSVPVWGPVDVVAALSVTAPTGRFPAARMSEALGPLREAARATAVALGRLDPPV